eukprot:1626289-Pleurochrysis_carterae.AAC.11
MAEKLSHVVRRIGEGASNLLDVEIALARATGQLAPTLVAIRDMLGELEAREVTQNLSAASGSAMLAKRPDDANNAAKKRDSKRTEKPNTFATQWSARFGLSPSEGRALCARNATAGVSFAGHDARTPSPTPSELSLAAQNEAELHANEERNRKCETSDSE